MMKDKANQHREASLHAHQGAVGKAIQWLERRYDDELQAWIAGTWFDGIDMGEISEIPAQLAESMNINAMEMLLAEGRWVNDAGVEIVFMDQVLGHRGPLMSAEQRQYLQALQEAPLRLWEVTDVLPGVGLTLADCMDATCIRRVQERSASRQIKPWDVIGSRPLQVPAGHWELSGAMYHFPRSDAEAVKQKLAEDLVGVPEDELPFIISEIIAFQWLQLALGPRPAMPQLMDAATGEPMMFVTEHYHVNDWAGLEARLSGAVDVDGDRKQGWHHLQKLATDSYRSLASINIGGKKERIELFTRSRTAADAQRLWFEALAGDTVRHLTRELGDPLSLFKHGAGKNTAPESEIPNDVQRKISHDYKRKHYAGWADEPLPELNGKTAREAVKTQTGRKAVISLLKDFENGEARNEDPFNFGFLWQELGLDR